MEAEILSSLLERETGDEEKEAEALGTIMAKEAISSPEIKTFNGVPHLLHGSKFANRFIIEERIGWNDVVGASYFAFPTNAKKELILRIDGCDRKEPSGLFVEAALLKLAESQQKHHFFTQFHSYDLTPKFPWLALYYRGGPPLNSCLSFLENKCFSHGTAGRFAHDILSILEFIHENAFLMTKLDMDILAVDPCSRNVFLADMSQVKVNPFKRNLRQKRTVSWMGFPDYAPLSYHGHADLTQWDELEAFFYLFYEMVVGSLPWSAEHLNTIEQSKLFFGQEEDSFKELPSQYLDLWHMVLESKRNQSGDYSKMKEICKEIFEVVGGIKDLEENYDFEVDFPDVAEEELPRFVLEKIPVADGSNEKDAATQEDDDVVPEDEEEGSLNKAVDEMDRKEFIECDT